MRTLRNLALMAGLLVGVNGLAVPAAKAQSGRCDNLLSAQQKVKCAMASGSFSDLETMLMTSLPQASAEELRYVIDGLEYERSQGNALAMLGLGTIYENGVKPVPQDVSKAAEYYLDAAAVGSAEGMMRVAMIYCDGLIPAPDLECFYFLRNAAEFGHLDALLILADKLVEKSDDFEGAKTYIEKAILLGVPGAEKALRVILQSRT